MTTPFAQALENMERANHSELIRLKKRMANDTATMTGKIYNQLREGK